VGGGQTVSRRQYGRGVEKGERRSPAKLLRLLHLFSLQLTQQPPQRVPCMALGCSPLTARRHRN
jgi:hypothetical protein